MSETTRSEHTKMLSETRAAVETLIEKNGTRAVLVGLTVVMNRKLRGIVDKSPDLTGQNVAYSEALTHVAKAHYELLKHDIR